MKKILACSLALLSGLAVFTAGSAARAADFAPAFATSRAGGFLDIWPARDYFGLWFGAELQLRVARPVFLDFSINGAYAEADPLNFKHAAYGNVTAGAHYADQVTPRFAFFVGGTLTLPLLHDPDGDVAGAALLAEGMRGYYDFDRFSPGRMAIRAMGGIEWQAARRFYFRAEARPVVSITTNDRYGTFFVNRRDAMFLIEHAAEGEYRLDNGLGFGLRLQGVLMPQENDVYQMVAEPFLALTPRARGLYLRLGFPVALDESMGFGFDRNKLATIRFAIGGQW